MSQTPPWPASPEGQQTSPQPAVGQWDAPGHQGRPGAYQGQPGTSPAPPAPAEPEAPPVPQMAPAAPPAPLGQSPYGQRPVQPEAFPGQPGAGQGSYGQFTFPVIEKQKFEPMAIAGVMTSVLGPVGIILGLLARKRVRETRRRSKTLAWTGIALGALFTVGWLLLAVTLTLNGTIDRALEHPQAGDVASPRTVASANLAIGNCLEFLPPSEQVGEVRLVPCTQSHIAQVVTVRELSGAFPGAGAVTTQATELCTADIHGLGATDVPVTLWFLAPSEAGWKQGNTQVVCLARGGAGPFNVVLVNS